MAFTTQKFSIVNIKNNTAYLQTIKEEGCGSCNANKGCGVGSLNRYFSKKLIENPLEQGQKVGDIVELTINSNKLFYHAFLLYFLPIIALFVSAYLVKIFFPSQEGYQVIFGLLGFGLSFIILKNLQH